MATDLSQIDPQWAWSLYEPDEQQPWDRRRAAHLLRRAAFGGTTAELDEAVGQQPQEAVARLVSGAEPEPFVTQMRALSRALVATGNSRRLSAWWLYRMLYTPHPLKEKMTLFWHGHFATSAEKVTDAQLMLAQNELLRQQALGDFRQLVHAISRDPAMLLYLDSATNSKTHPNENYARELMELFCLGEGHYSEQDVQELARCFTGWEIRQGRFHFNRYQHDFGEKTILGKTGPLTGEDAIDWVVQQPDAPQFITAKLFRYFVSDEPEPPTRLLEPLVAELQQSNFVIAPLVRRMLSSRLFFDDSVLGRKVRAPVDVTMGLLRSLEGTTDINQLASDVALLGQELFYPPNVKGWDGGRAWINSSTLLSRANVLRRLLESDKSRFAGGSLESYLQQQAGSSPAEIVDWLAELLVAVPLPRQVRQHLITLAASRAADRFVTVLHVLGSLPEFQLA